MENKKRQEIVIVYAPSAYYGTKVPATLRNAGSSAAFPLAALLIFGVSVR
jgi:hypothetical protein